MLKRLVFPVGLIIVMLGVYALMGTWGQGSEQKNLSYFETPSQVVNFGALNKLDGSSYDVDKDIVDKLAIVTFFNTQCAECAVGDRLISDLSIDGKAVTKIYIHIGGTAETVKNYLLDNPLSGEVLVDQDMALYKKLQPSTPSTFVLLNGQSKYYFPGQISTELISQLAKKLATL